MSERKMAPEHRWIEDGLSFAVHDNGILLGNVERFGRELLCVVHERDALGKALLRTWRALHAHPGEGIHACLSYAALGDALPEAEAALRAAGLLPEEQA